MTGRKQFAVADALEAAMRTFWVHGYADTSLEMLSQTTGLGRGSLYGTFGSKEKLFRSCLDRYVVRYGSRYEAAIAEHPGDPGGAMTAFFEVALDRLTGSGSPGGCLLCQAVDDGAVLGRETREYAAGLLGLQYDRVRAGLEPAPLPAHELDGLARLVVTVNQGLAIMHRSGAPEEHLRQVAALTCQTIAARIASSKPS